MCVLRRLPRGGSMLRHILCIRVRGAMMWSSGSQREVGAVTLVLGGIWQCLVTYLAITTGKVLLASSG